MQYEHLMSAVAQEPERRECQLAIEEQIGDEHHQSAAAELVDHPAERRFGGGALSRACGRRVREQLVPMGVAGPRRQHPSGPSRRT